MKTRNILGPALGAVLALVSCAEKDMTRVDEWLGEKFNQEIRWDVDSMAFRRAPWLSEDVADGVQVRKSTVKMQETVQSISYVTYSPNMFNTYLGYTGQEATVGEIAGSYGNALFAINAGSLKDGKPAAFFKLDKEVVTPATESPDADAVVGLTANILGVTMKVSANVEETSDYTSAMAAGPLLLRNGKEIDFSEATGEFYTKRMARTIIGVTASGNYIMGVIDGGAPGTADGATVQEAAFIARLMGLDFAALLGCGDETTAWSVDKGVINSPSAGSAQKVGTVIYIGPGTSRVSGEGTEGSPYLIENHVHMTQMRALCPEGKKTYFKLMDDVDMSEVKVWTPVNFDGDFSRQVDFDGNGKTISNFAPDQFVADDQSTAAAYPSLFGVLYGSCRNLHVTDSRIIAPGVSSCGILGGFVGTNNKPAEVENVHITNAEIEGKANLGAFGGQSRDASYKNCSAKVKIVSSGTDVGGIAGKVAGIFTIEGCTAEVEIYQSANPGSNARYGGLLGYAATIGGTDLTRDKLTVKHCSTSGKISSDQFSCNCSSGLVAYVGMPEAEITECFTEVNILSSTSRESKGRLSNTGGIVGTVSVPTSCKIENCYSSGTFHVWQCSAGIVGRHEKGALTINNCYSTYDILGYSGLGGIIGQSKAGLTVTITKSFAWNPSVIAFRDAGDKYSSGAIGGSISGINTITGCFRHPEMVFTDPFRTIQTHGDLSAGTPEGAANQNAYDGTPSSEATLTAAAKKAGWSEAVWDFSTDVPLIRK